jgi:hypothetical protein
LNLGIHTTLKPPNPLTFPMPELDAMHVLLIVFSKLPLPIDVTTKRIEDERAKWAKVTGLRV